MQQHEYNNQSRHQKDPPPAGKKVGNTDQDEKDIADGIVAAPARIHKGKREKKEDYEYKKRKHHIGAVFFIVGTQKCRYAYDKENNPFYVAPKWKCGKKITHYTSHGQACSCEQNCLIQTDLNTRPVHSHHHSFLSVGTMEPVPTASARQICGKGFAGYRAHQKAEIGPKVIYRSGTDFTKPILIIISNSI
ncbi:MAG: hypothetical protein LKK00_05460 [Intestinimonas sp.]|jgi:hypothetical protein|nr:hypothetical protein [Intestinimonas sp.]